MHRFATALCVSMFLAVSPAFCAAIGIALANGSFRVDNNLTVGNATLFEGNTLETGAASSELELWDGARLRLGSDSRGQVFRNRLVLEKGVSELDTGPGYWIEARGLRILPGGPDAVGRVAVDGSRKVQAAALAGSLRVTTADGTVVALLVPGKALEFEPQGVTGVQAPFEMTGCVERRGGRLALRDPVSGVTEEIRGERLEGEVGRMIEVTATVLRGVQPVEGAQEVIQVSKFRRVSGECAVPAAPPAAPLPAKPAVPPAAAPPPPAAQPSAPPRRTAPPASTPAPTPPRHGMSGATKAVIAGVIVGGAGAGAAVYFKVVRNENKGTISR